MEDSYKGREMNRHPRFLHLASVIAFVLPLGGSLCAQVPDPLVATQAPVAGAGHHYIGTGAETVNPADGSLTFDLPIQTPAGRALSFPEAPATLATGG